MFRQLQKIKLLSPCNKPLQATLLTLGLLFVQPFAMADTNATGVEIDVINDIDMSTYGVDPVQSYLPETDSSKNQAPALSNSGLSSTNQLKSSLPGFNQVSSDDLWGRIKDGYAMPELKSNYVDNHTNWYVSRPEYVQRMVQRSQKYLFHIVEEVQKRGMPTEIALLPMVESAFNPKANSTSRASGIWQFIPSTGKDFGLKQNWWVDNRRGVTAATSAALTYLQKLHGMFGSWDLALAAYNAGEGTVQRAINRNRSKGLPTDYESLNLPAETKNYVPKLQAIKNIMTHPEQYGLKIDTIPNRPYFVKVSAPQQIDMHLAAQLAEISFEEFTALNPEYNRPVATTTANAKDNLHEILLPVSAAQTFTENLSNYDKPLVSWQAYHAKRGERMDHIASKFGINVAQLREANGMSAGKKVASTSTMLVPSSASNNDDTSKQADSDTADNIDTTSLENNNLATSLDNSERNTKLVLHKAKKGESIAEVAKKYGVNAKQLMAQNSLKSGQLKTGQIIKVSFIKSSLSTKPSAGKSDTSKANATKYKHNNKSNKRKSSSSQKVNNTHHKRHV